MSTDESYKNGHRARLRRKLATFSLAVEDSEVLELVIGLVQPRGDTKPLAKALLKRFKSMRGVLDARSEELLDMPGFGEKTLQLWQLLREIMIRYAESPVRTREVIVSSHQIAAMARIRLGTCPHEEVWVALLDAGNRLIDWKKLDEGTGNASSVHVARLLKLALDYKASAMILVHNHPGGTLRPSNADIGVTKALMKSAEAAQIRLLDHLVLTDESWFSFKDEKMLSPE